jgi:hypothetical protein
MYTLGPIRTEKASNGTSPSTSSKTENGEQLPLRVHRALKGPPQAKKDPTVQRREYEQRACRAFWSGMTSLVCLSNHNFMIQVQAKNHNCSGWGATNTAARSSRTKTTGTSQTYSERMICKER